MYVKMTVDSHNIECTLLSTKCLRHLCPYYTFSLLNACRKTFFFRLLGPVRLSICLFIYLSTFALNAMLLKYKGLINIQPSKDLKGRHRRESKNKKQETKRFSTFAVYRLRHSETKRKYCLIRESCFSGGCAKEPINNLSQVTWLCTWLPK